MSAAGPRTFAVGDIHGDLAALDRLVARLPSLTAEDTLVFLGDYVDRGPDARGVVARVRALPSETPARVVALQGNHEEKWVSAFRKGEPMFLLPVGNGCGATFRSFTGRPRGDGDGAVDRDDMSQFLDVRSWMPADVVEWMASLPTWYEDERAIYVHAGLDGEGTEWKHPRDGSDRAHLWMREPDFYSGYRGKTVVFGHTTVGDLPTDHLGTIARVFDDPGDVWRRGDLIGLDTGCGKGGFLSAIELPRGKVYESR